MIFQCHRIRLCKSTGIFSLELRPALGASLPVKHCVHVAHGRAALLRQRDSKSFNRAECDNKGSQILPKFENIDATDYCHPYHIEAV